MDRDYLLRYSRQINLPSIDIEGQEKISTSRVLIIGMGGLGCAAAQYLASSGVGTLTIVDDDKVDLSNLHRQILHCDKDIDRDKVDSASEKLKLLNPSINLHTFKQHADENLLKTQVPQHQVVLDCTDNYETRCLINRYCYQYRVPLVSGAAIRMEGQFIRFNYQDKEPCYQCMANLFGKQNLSCVEAGVLAPVVGIIGNMQALEALLLITRDEQTIHHDNLSDHCSLLLYDASQCEFKKIRLNKDPACTVCGVSRDAPAENF